MTTRDDAIKAQVEKVLSRNMQNSNLGINIQVEKGYVTLHGVVDVLAEKMAAGELVRQIQEINGLDNSLTVGADRFLDDEEITEKVTQNILNDRQLDGKKIGAQTHRGIVTLVGSVNTLAEKDMAMKLATTVPGVKEVQSALRFVEADYGPTDDASLVNEVERAFVAHSQLRADDIGTTCQNGVVRLEGTVDNYVQKLAAERVAGTVPGVRRIINGLSIRHGETEGDRNLTNIARETLRETPNISPAQVKVYVVDGIAYLSGDVYSVEAKHTAEKAIAKLEGIEQVMNDIQVVVH